MYANTQTETLKKGKSKLVDSLSLISLDVVVDSFECADDIINQVLSIFDTNTQPNEVIENTALLPRLYGDSSVGHASWQLAKTLNPTEGFCKCEDFGFLAEPLGGATPTLDSERDHTTTHTLTVLQYGNLALRVRIEAGVVDRKNVWRGLKDSSDGSGILSCGLCTEVKSLQTTMGKPAVKWRGNRADCVLEEREAVVKLRIVECSNTH